MAHEQPTDGNGYKLLAYLRDYVRRDEHERQMREMEEDIERLETRVDKEASATYTDLKEIHDDLQRVKEAIIKKQVEERNRIIGIQAMLLSPIVIAVIIYIVQSFLPK